MRAAKDRLRAAFTAAPYRPTGLATADQALGSLVQLLEWGSTQVGEAFDGHIDLTQACPQDRALLRAAADLFGDTQALLTGQDGRAGFRRDRERPGRRRPSTCATCPAGPASRTRGSRPRRRCTRRRSRSWPASVAADALIVSHRASAETIEAERRDWYGSPGAEPGDARPRRACRRAGAHARGRRRSRPR